MLVSSTQRSNYNYTVFYINIYGATIIVSDKEILHALNTMLLVK